MKWNPLKWFSTPQVETSENKEADKGVIPPGRVSIPKDDYNTVVALRQDITLITPSFRSDIIPLIRDLYKVNPDMSIAVQDMFKLANTGHTISFPNNTPEEAKAMKDHLAEASKTWSNYTAGINGLVNKFIVQCLTSGAISVEAVPKNDLSGVSTIVFVNPEEILFRRLKDGVYQPYQKNPYAPINKKADFIKLNPETYIYVGMYNDTDEPYGVPPFMAALDSIKGQHDMRVNFKHIMELMGMVGFLEVKMEKPPREPSESIVSYRRRLEHNLQILKKNMLHGIRDGIVTGYKDDHEFKLNSTSSSLQNIQEPWIMNQQSVANGLGINSNIIGIQNSNTEGGAGILLSKMISQLKNIQMLAAYVLEFIYSLDLRLAGFNNKGIQVEFKTSTISDEMKVQQGLEYKIRNLIALYNQGIINQQQLAWAMGYEKPDQKEPRAPIEDESEVGSINDSAKKQKREADKDTSDRRTRDKNNPVPKRKDQNSKPS